jgi:RNA polymerase sigma-70 factor, ECF subfamily
MSDLANGTHGPPMQAEQVFRDFAPRVYHLARRILGNDADAQDATQDVMVQVVRKLDSFRGESAFPTWLHRVTVNAALAHRRKQSNRKEQVVSDPMEHFVEDGHRHPVKHWTERPEHMVLDQEREGQIEAAIARLPDDYREVFVLSDVEQLPNAEIADILGLSIPAVKSRLHRARLMMRDHLTPYFEEVSV